jgi:hypothetical protein
MPNIRVIQFPGADTSARGGAGATAISADSIHYLVDLAASAK